MWIFDLFKKKTEPISATEIIKSLNERWIDADARITALEFANQEYRKANRRNFSAPPKELNTSEEGGLLKRTNNGLQK